MYGKIFSSMFDGSLYGNWEAIVTFQQMIVLCDKEGNIDMTPQAIAARTSIPLHIIQAGIEILESPDKYSRSPDQDGRRIERLDDHRPWGWRLVNYSKYRMLVDSETVREQNRERQRRKREREKVGNIVTDCDSSRDVTVRNASHAPSRQAEVEVEVEVVKRVGDAKPSSERSSRLRLDLLPKDWASFCTSERPDLDPQATWERFRDFWLAKPGAGGRKLDWFATWRNWVRNERAQTKKPANEKPEWMINMI